MVKKQKFWLECYAYDEEKTVQYIEEIGIFRSENEIVKNFINSNKDRNQCGLFYITPEDQSFLKRITKNEINFKKYGYEIITEEFHEKSARWEDNDYIYEFDYRRDRVDKYLKYTGEHLGKFCYRTGKMTNSPIKRRKLIKR